MAERYVVVYTGVLQPGVDPEQAASAFAARFGADPSRVREMLQSGDSVIIKSGLSAAQALEYRRALTRIGLTVRIDPPLNDEPDDAQAVPPHLDPPACPGADPGGTPNGATNGVHEPHRMPAAHGWSWLKQGFSMVFAHPVHWIGALLIWTVINFAMNLVPLVNVLSALVAAVFMGGLMLGAHQQARGEGFRIERLFAGFSNRFGALLLVGLFYMLGFIAIALVMVLSLGGLFAMAPGVWSQTETGLPPEVLWSPVTWLPVLLVFALLIPLMMAYWFAPVLVVVDGMPPVRAMAQSFRACLRNILPFVLYGVISLVLLVLGTIPLLLGLLVVIPALVASVYAAYADIFR